jgi:hypothetical protein
MDSKVQILSKTKFVSDKYSKSIDPRTYQASIIMRLSRKRNILHLSDLFYKGEMKKAYKYVHQMKDPQREQDSLNLLGGF